MIYPPVIEGGGITLHGADLHGLGVQIPTAGRATLT